VWRTIAAARGAAAQARRAQGGRLPPCRIRPPADAAAPLRRDADAPRRAGGGGGGGGGGGCGGGGGRRVRSRMPPCRIRRAGRRGRCRRAAPPRFRRTAPPPQAAAVAAGAAPAAATLAGRRARGGRRPASIPCHGRRAGADSVARRQPYFLLGYAAGRWRQRRHRQRCRPMRPAVAGSSGSKN